MLHYILFVVFKVCKVFLEMLHDRGVLYNVTLAKFEGKDT